jgi:hypothetical protein
VTLYAAPTKRSRVPGWISRLITRWQLRHWQYMGATDGDPYEDDEDAE